MPESTRRFPAAAILAVLSSAAFLAPDGRPARAAAPTFSEAAQEPPSVLLIMVDDLGYGDLSSYGARDIETPHIDGIGHAGVRFTDFYAAASVCTPTRAALMTGRYPQRLQNFDRPLQSPENESRGLPVDGRSLPRLLKERGYATGLVGKWHLGYTSEYSPAAHGFDPFFGIKSGFVNYWEHTHGGVSDLWEHDAAVSLDGHITDLITERALAFLREHVHRPFFLDVSYTAPHVGAGSIGDRSQYVETVEHLDAAVGELLTALDALGIGDRTLVVFTNDNGGENSAHNGPLFHRKWTVWEGGIRVPAMIRWPGRVPAGLVSHQVGTTMDVTATILAAAGVLDAVDAPADGMDLIPVVTGASAEVSRTLFWRSPDRRQAAVRSGEWKLMAEAGGSFGPHLLLYDLRTDVGERNDLSSLYPEVVRSLRAALDEWLREVTGDEACVLVRAVNGLC